MERVRRSTFSHKEGTPEQIYSTTTSDISLAPPKTVSNLEIMEMNMAKDKLDQMYEWFQQQQQQTYPRGMYPLRSEHLPDLDLDREVDLETLEVRRVELVGPGLLVVHINPEDLIDPILHTVRDILGKSMKYHAVHQGLSVGIILIVLNHWEAKIP